MSRVGVSRTRPVEKRKLRRGEAAKPAITGAPELTSRRQSGTFQPDFDFQWERPMQGQTRAICAALSIFCLAVAGGTAGASEVSRAPAIKAGGPVAAPTEVSSQARGKRRAPRRVHIYGRPRGPGPNSVRICNAHYEQEFRPSGTVIVPRMHCYWSG
jgi:hypothetical protein